MLKTAFTWFMGLARIAKISIVALGIAGIGAITSPNNDNKPTAANLNVVKMSSSKKEQVTKKIVVEKEAIPYTTTNQDDDSLEKGQSKVLTTGVNGERTIKYLVLYTNGEETSRSIVSNVVSKKPIAEVIAIGTQVKETRESNTNCDPNYSGGCVPIASDVDCGGGSGNGPAYFYGTATVIGYDIYGLDRDNDGLACE